MMTSVTSGRSAENADAREQKLTEWVDRYSEQLLHLCFVYLSDWHLAEDAVQNTFRKAWKRMDSQEIENDRAWLCRIALNTARDLRREKWYRQTDLRCALSDLPESRLSVEAEDRTLFLTVCGLPENQKQAVLLYYYQGFTLEETARILGKGITTVRRRLRRAEQTLKLELGGMEDA